MTRWALIALCGIAACTERETTGAVDEAIVGGTAAAGDPAVVAIAHRRVFCGDAPAVTCSGVLVAPRVVLTAAHCLDGVPARGALEVVFGGDAATPAKVIVVAGAQAYGGYDAMTGDGDVAALLLAEDAPVAPIARPTGSVADVADGGALRAVGYGVTALAAADPGVKREGTLARGAVRAASFDAAPAPAMTCAGDSGGPVFATIGAGEQLVGLTSRGDPGCATAAVNARVDVAQAPLVDPFVSASASAPPGWPAGLPPIEALAGTPCAADTDCPALMTCSEQQRCALAWLGPGTLEGACASDTDCAVPQARCARVWPDGDDACHCFAAAHPPDPPHPDAGPDEPAPPDGCGCSARGTDGWPISSLLILLALRRRKR